DAADDRALVEADRGLPGEAVLGEELGGPGRREAPLEPDAGAVGRLAGEPLREGDEQVLPDIAAQLGVGTGGRRAERGAAGEAVGRALRRDAEVVEAGVLGERLEPAGGVAPDGGGDGLEPDLPGGGAERGL